LRTTRHLNGLTIYLNRTIMRSMKFIGQILFLMLGVVISLQAVPPVLNYAGQVAVNGQPFEGEGLFKFALVNTDGKITYWSNDGTSVNGSEPQASVKASVSGGLYSLLLGNTAIPGMGAINPTIFVTNTDAKLRVWFSDGVNGFQQLSPDRPFASVPFAFSAGTAQTAGSANIANGAINLDMLSQDVKTQLNAPIGLNRLSSEVTAKLDQNGTGGSGVVAGSLISVPYGQSAPAGYSLYQQGEPKELVWEEKAPVSEARMVYDGVDVIEDKIYLMGGYSSDQGTPINYDLTEVYDPSLNSWSTLNPMSAKRPRAASSVLDDKLYAIGGSDLDKVEIFDPTTGIWSQGTAIPEPWIHAQAVTYENKIYLIGGTNSSGTTNELLVFDPSSNNWNNKANMPIARSGIATVIFQKRIWVFGGNSNKVHSYDPETNTWQNERDSLTQRYFPVAWLGNGRIYLAGGGEGSDVYSSIEAYDPITETWATQGSLPENKYVANAIVLNDKVYVIAGSTGSGAYSDKVYAADLNTSVDGVYDLYRKEGNASAGTPIVQAEVADGSVTASKIASKTIGKDQISDSILKYLKPEITVQPQAQIVYADSNVSYSVTAEGKYLTYQWKKDGSNLTGETNATLNITDANATQHDGNYSVVVSNDFGSVESAEVEVKVSDPLPNGLVGWWKFDEGSGTVAYDSSGNGNHGNLKNGATWTTGKIEGALSFDGVNDYVDLTSTTVSANESDPRSVFLWVKTSSSSARTIFSSGSPFNSASFNLRNSNAGIVGIMGYSNDFYPSSGNQYNDNVWHLIGITYDFLKELKTYVDGNLDNNISGMVFNTFGENNFIGARRDNSSVAVTGFFNGLIDDLRIYDRALSAAEVQALYNLGQ
jgi:N-acetylneuraminic acid mutarotase